MFIEEKAPGEVQAPVEITKLSQAIRVGAALVSEDGTWWGCALATAGVALGHQRRFGGDVLPFLHERLGVPASILLDVNQMHCRGMPRLKIADWLESIGQ